MQEMRTMVRISEVSQQPSQDWGTLFLLMMSMRAQPVKIMIRKYILKNEERHTLSCSLHPYQYPLRLSDWFLCRCLEFDDHDHPDLSWVGTSQKCCHVENLRACKDHERVGAD